MRAIVVGARGTTRELLRRLGEVWDVVVVSTSEELLKSAGEIRPFEAVIGDGSSAVVLKRAGLEEADAVVAASADDDLNLEALRIAMESGVLRVVGVAADPERLADYTDLGIPAYAPDTLTARHVEVSLEPRRVASTGFADGKAEAIEFSIAPDAPVRGKKLRDLHSETWIIAAILRDGQLIVPHGSTSIETGDRVTVVGAASDFQAIVKTFTSGESSFPLGFGRKAVVAIANHDDLHTVLADANNFVRNSRAETLTIIHRDPDAQRDPSRAEEIEALVEQATESVRDIDVELRPTSQNIDDELLTVAREESVGTVVVRAPSGNRFAKRRRFAKLVNRYGPLGVPIFVARGTSPWGEILVPARQTKMGETAGRAAIDLARTSGALLTGVAVVGPTFVTGIDTMAQARASAAWLREEAAVQSVTVRRRIRRGNPVRVIEELAQPVDLLVIAMPTLPARWYRPGITGYLGESLACSMLLVPPLR